MSVKTPAFIEDCNFPTENLFNKRSIIMTTRYALSFTGTANTSLLIIVTTRNIVVSNKGDVFNRISMPSNVRMLEKDEMSTLNFDVHQDWVGSNKNFAHGKESKLPNNLYYDQTTRIFSFGKDILPKIAKDWLGQ